MKNLTIDDLLKIKGGVEDFVLINVLDEDEFNRHHIPGSINIPLHPSAYAGGQSTVSFASRVDREVGDRDAQIVVYCACVDCPASKMAAQQLDDAGFTNVSCYEGGMKEWEAFGQVVKGVVASQTRS